MNCPECESETKVIDSRKKPGYIYRRRKCECGTRFSTREVAFNIQTPAQAEIRRLEELNKLIDSQIKDANASLKGKVVKGGTKSVRSMNWLDEPDANGKSRYERIGDNGVRV